jgi:hypothetical protein
VKVKNREHPAYRRVQGQFSGQFYKGRVRPASLQKELECELTLSPMSARKYFIGSSKTFAPRS